MAEVKNKDLLVQMEYAFQQYFDRHFVGVVNSEYKELRSRQQEEYRRKLDARPAAPGMSGMMNASMAAQEVRLTGEWNTKDSEWLIQRCQEKLFKDTKIQQDMQAMADCWKASIISEIGQKDYDELSKGVPGGDLSNYYVSNRFQSLFLEHLAKKDVPKSTLEFIWRKLFDNSLPGMIGGIGMPSSDMDKMRKELAEQFYRPSVAEKGAAFVLTSLTDTAMTGGMGTVPRMAGWLAVDGGLHALGSVIPSEKTFDQQLGEVIWGDSDAVAALRADSTKVDPQQSAPLAVLNRVLNKQVFRPKFDYQDYRELLVALREALDERGHGGTASGIEAALKSVGFQVKKDRPFPPSLSKMSDEELFNEASSCCSLAITMKSQGIREMVWNGKKVTRGQMAQRAYNCARALEASIRQSRSANADNDVERQQQDAGSQQGAAYAIAVSDPGQTQQQTQQQGQQQGQQQTQQKGQQQGRQMQQQYQTQQQYQQLQNGQGQSVDGWGGMFDSLGLGGFADLGKNLGYVLAMLPDMVAAMFTGQSRNLKFGDNLLAIGAIVMGMFVKSPFLKLLLIGLGGASLLSKASQGVLDDGRGRQQPVRQYRRYGDEVLDARIQQPVMRGNTLVATIDHVPSVITISDDAVDAYEKGFIPLNTLANAVLRRYDEQRAAVAEHYERQLSEERSSAVSYGLR